MLEAQFEEALKLEPGGDIFVECEDKTDRIKLIKELDRMLRKYVNVDPIIASQLVFRATFRDMRHWVRIHRKSNDPSIVWKKDTNGNIEKVVIGVNFKLKRMIELMKRDNYSIERIREELIEEDPEEVNRYLKEEV
jgi:hypothetical protein